MKLRLVLAFSTLAAIVVAYADSDGSEYVIPDYRAEYCDIKNNSTQKSGCALIKCTKDNRNITVLGCPDFQCQGKLVRAMEDINKQYPDCCLEPPCEIPKDLSP